MSKKARQTMPLVAAWIDEMRAAFGADIIDEAIRRGMRGEPTFWARENGHELGTRAPEPRNALSVNQLVLEGIRPAKGGQRR